MRHLLWIAPLVLVTLAHTWLTQPRLTAQDAGTAAAPAVETLVADLASDDVAKAEHAAQALAKLGPQAAGATGALTKLVDSEFVRLRVAAIEALAAIGPEAKAALPALIARFEDTDLANEREEVWVLASRATGRMGEAAVQPLIEQLLPDQPRRYVAACGALHDIGPASLPAMPILLPQIEKDDSLTIPSMFAVAGLGTKGAEAVPAIVKILDSENFHHQYWACQALGAMGEAAHPAIPKLIERMQNGVVSVRRHAAAALGNLGAEAGPEAIAALIAAIDERLEPVREEAVIALGKMGPAAESAIPKLKENLAKTRMTARARLAGALWRINPKDEAYAMEVLMAEIQAPNAPWSAADELAFIAPKVNRVAEVAKLLESDQEETPQFAADALGGMGAAAREYLPALKRLAADEQQHEDVRAAAQEAIEKIESALAAAADAK